MVHYPNEKLFILDTKVNLKQLTLGKMNKAGNSSGASASVLVKDGLYIWWYITQPQYVVDYTILGSCECTL